MKLVEIMKYLDLLAPLAWQESWDKSGLAIGDPEQDVANVLLALDLASRAVEQAFEMGADLLVTHHPPFFHPLEGVRAEVPEEKLIRDLVRADLAVYAMHTNLDAAPWGVNDSLFHQLGLAGEVSPEPLVPLVGESACVVEVPLFAGHEAYQGMKPGFGKVLSGSYTRYTLQDLCWTKLASPCQVNFEEDAPLGRIVLSGGSWDGAWLPLLVERKIDAVITGEMKYHEQIACRERGISAFMLGHDVSERLVLPFLAKALETHFAGELHVRTYEGLKYRLP